MLDSYKTMMLHVCAMCQRACGILYMLFELLTSGEYTELGTLTSILRHLQSRTRKCQYSAQVSN